MTLRIGHGYDVHRLVAGRRLVLGGVEIPFEKGLLGHSDADVLAHAVADAVLGAAGLGDIGRHFPDTDVAFAGADSLDLLRRCVALAAQKGWAPANVDTVVVAQQPRLAPYAEDMRKNLAAALGLDPDAVNVKAKTEEGLGFTGAGEAIAAHAVALLTAVSDATANSEQRAVNSEQ
jgi:2-C-methyl-D-erythritol 2,4-cyclodiphosphate synthase